MPVCLSVCLSVPARLTVSVCVSVQQMDEDRDGLVTLEELRRWCGRDPDFLRSLHMMDTVL